MLDVECTRGPLILSSNVTVSACLSFVCHILKECLSLEICLLTYTNNIKIKNYLFFHVLSFCFMEAGIVFREQEEYLL